MAGKVTGAGGKGFSAEITVEGLTGLLGALKAFEPDMLKRMMKEIRAATRTLQSAAMTKYSATGGSGGYVIRNSTRGKSPGMRVVATRSVSGGSTSDWATEGRLSAILELYGSRSAGSPRAVSTTATLNERYGQPARFLWSSWDSVKGEAIPRIEAAVKAAEQQVQKTIDQQGG